MTISSASSARPLASLAAGAAGTTRQARRRGTAHASRTTRRWLGSPAGAMIHWTPGWPDLASDLVGKPVASPAVLQRFATPRRTRALLDRAGPARARGRAGSALPRCSRGPSPCSPRTSPTGRGRLVRGLRADRVAPPPGTEVELELGGDHRPLAIPARCARSSPATAGCSTSPVLVGRRGGQLHAAALARTPTPPRPRHPAEGAPPPARVRPGLRPRVQPVCFVDVEPEPRSAATRAGCCGCMTPPPTAARTTAGWPSTCAGCSSTTTRASCCRAGPASSAASWSRAR